MTFTQTPPLLRSSAPGEVQRWANELVSFLRRREAPAQQAVVVQLARRNAALGDSAAGQDGKLMFDSAGYPVVSITSAWVPVALANAGLDDLQGFYPPADSTFLVGTGTAWALETASTARTSLGLGTIATQAASNVSITGGSATGISAGVSGDLNTPSAGALTIATGSITPTAFCHLVDTESAAATDDLDTITATASDWIFLRTVDAARDVVLTEAGNIIIPGGTTVTLGEVTESALLFCTGTSWIVVSTTGTVA